MSESLALIPRSIDECAGLAERLATSELLPKALRGKVPDVMMTIMAGQEMGLAPMAALRLIYVIEGKPVLAADGMVALVYGSGKAVYFDRVEESDTSVTYETMRVGSKIPRRCTWTMAMAKAAALHLKDNWRGYPRAMLASRAKAELARDVYPDVLAGVYTTDEIDHTRNPPREPAPAAPEPDVIDAEIVEGPELAAIDAATTIDELKATTKALSALSGEAKNVARVRYQAKLDALRTAAPVEAVA